MKTLEQECRELGIDSRTILIKHCFGKRRRKTILREKIKFTRVLIACIEAAASIKQIGEVSYKTTLNFPPGGIVF
jgi:hypothetical protein